MASDDSKTTACSDDCDLIFGGLCTCGARGPTCPICDGKGGALIGYYEPEWDDCGCCDGAGRALPEIVAAFRARTISEAAEVDAWVNMEVAKLKAEEADVKST